MSTPTQLDIDFVSDVACPWCAIGLQGLLEAIARVAPAIQVHLRFQPFELNPGMPAEGEDLDAHLSRKYGTTSEQNAQARAAIRARGEAVGFHFDMETRRRIHPTFDAHRLLHWAGDIGEAAQLALKQALLRAHFGSGRSTARHSDLLDAVTVAGLDTTAARHVLEQGLYADEVRTAEAHFTQAGIRAVPSVIVNGRHLIQGGLPAEAYEQALRQIAQAL
jgi:predicted DsbA family dithiol-disulfide isomerase